MGREVKRIHLDFDWPMGKVWKGFLNPYHFPCPETNKTCFGGYTGARKWLESFVRLIMLAGEEPHRDNPRAVTPHPYKSVPVSDDMSELTAGLGGRGQSTFGHDACDAYAATRKIIGAAGLGPDTWGICPVCHGYCEDLALKAISDCWESHEPPAGPGWQMWETVSEGSPISPVFETAEELAAWLADTGTSTSGSETATFLEWLKFIEGPGWAPSAMSSPDGGLVSGVKMFSKGKPDAL